MSVNSRRSLRPAVLAVFALTGSLLAVSASPSVAAGDGKPSNTATYSACVAAATTDAGFTDMAGYDSAAANCLAHYGITTGTAPGMYSPGAKVTRAQMAVFLARAAGPAGIDLGAVMDQGFTDIDGYNMMFRDAINRVARNMIVKGTTETTFSPDAAVSRADMAVFLDAFVSKAMIGPGGLGGASKYAEVKPDDDPFTDTGAVSIATHGSIRKVYELGIAAGTGAGMFSPAMAVTRHQMASFITEALAHTNARPAGLSLQVDRTTANTGADGGFMLHAALRSSDHKPTANTSVDTFSAASASAAFDKDGLCKTIVASPGDPAASSLRCVVDTGDDETDLDGNVLAEVVNTAAYCPGSKRIWAWTGANGAAFDNDSTAAAFADIEVSRHWRSFNVTSTLKKHATHVKFGQAVIYTIQLVDGAMGKGDAVAQKGVDFNVRLVESATPGGNNRTVTRTHKTNASGRVVLTFSYDDPDALTSGHLVTLSLSTTSPAAVSTGPAPGTGGGGGGGRPQGASVTIGSPVWTDAAAAARTLVLSTRPHSYTKASSEGGGARNTVEALLVDQFGDPVAGVPVHFWSNSNNHNSSDADNGLGGASSTVNNGAGSVKAPSGQSHLGSVDNFATTVRTNSKGVARTSYFRDSAVRRVEEIGAVAQIGRRDGAGSPANSETDDIYMRDGDTSTPRLDTFRHYWVREAPTTLITNYVAIAVNKAAREMVISNNGLSDFWLVRYDSNDQFNAPVGPSGSRTQQGVNLEDFESIIGLNERYTVKMAANPVAGVNLFTMTTGGITRPVPCHN